VPRGAWGDIPTAYNPYAGLPGTTLDPGMLEKLYNLPEQPEFLFAEEAGVRHRNMGENFTFCTGVGYFSGASRLHVVDLRLP
jgi:hypothetical protein